MVYAGKFEASGERTAGDDAVVRARDEENRVDGVDGESEENHVDQADMKRVYRFVCIYITNFNPPNSKTENSTCG